MRPQVRLLSGAPFPFNSGDFSPSETHSGLRQRSLRAADADLFAFNFNAIDEQTQVLAARGLPRIAQLIGNQFAEPRHYVWRDLAPTVIELPLDQFDIDCGHALLRRDVPDLSFDLGIVGSDAAKPDQLDDVGALSFEQRRASSQNGMTASLAIVA